MNPRPSLPAVLAALALAGCGHSQPPSSLKNREIYSAQLLRIGLVDFGTGFNRRGLDRCPNEFPAVEVESEAALLDRWKQSGLAPEHLLTWGEDFARFRAVGNLHLLFLVFEQDSKPYLRSVNFLSRTVSTVKLDVAGPRCDELLRKERVIVVDSYPPLADVSLGGRVVGEAPAWIALPKGTHEVRCELPGQIFKPVAVTIPGVVQALCQRENTAPPEQDELTGSEKAGSVLVYVVGGLASIAAVVLPLLFLF